MKNLIVFDRRGNYFDRGILLKSEKLSNQEPSTPLLKTKVGAGVSLKSTFMSRLIDYV